MPTRWVLPTGPKAPKGVIVTDAPTSEDSDRGELLAPESLLGRQFTDLMTEAGLNRAELYMASAIACPVKHPIRDRELKEAVRCCAPLLRYHLSQLQGIPSVMVLGDMALKALGCKETSIASTRGFVDYDWQYK